MKHIKLFENHYSKLKDYFEDKINFRMVRDIIDLLIRYEDVGKICFLYVFVVSVDGTKNIIYGHTNLEDNEYISYEGWCDFFNEDIGPGLVSLIDMYEKNGYISYRISVYDNYSLGAGKPKVKNEDKVSEVISRIVRKYSIRFLDAEGNFVDMNYDTHK